MIVHTIVQSLKQNYLLTNSGQMAKKKPSSPKNNLQKVYREFTRVKFNKYKLQFPRLRESQIVTKIIREWEAMDEEQKQAIQKQFVERSGLKFLDESDSSSSKKNDIQHPQSPKKLSSSRKRSLSPKVRVFQEKYNDKYQKDNDSGIKRSDGVISGKKSTPQRQSSSHANLEKMREISRMRNLSRNMRDSSRNMRDSSRNKKSSSSNRFSSDMSRSTPTVIIKLSNKHNFKGNSKKDEYLDFYRYYFQRLGSEHPRWNTNQINTIIKLLWRKRVKSSRKNLQIKTRKKLSPFQYYKKMKKSEGYMEQQIKPMWKALPFQSKKYWSIKAVGKPERKQKSVKNILKKGAVQQKKEYQNVNNSIKWMNNVMG